LLADIAEQHISYLHKKHSYLLGQIRNADEMLVFLNMPSNTTITEKGAKSVLLKTVGNEKLHIDAALTLTT
jgi:hypothetical protein